MQAEFSIAIIKPCLDKLPQGQINVEDILVSFYEELAMKLSVDDDTVSLNAFEMFTRAKGLQEPIKRLFEDCAMRHKS